MKICHHVCAKHGDTIMIACSRREHLIQFQSISHRLTWHPARQMRKTQQDALIEEQMKNEKVLDAAVDAATRKTSTSPYTKINACGCLHKDRSRMHESWQLMNRTTGQLGCKRGQTIAACT